MIMVSKVGTDELRREGGTEASGAPGGGLRGLFSALTVSYGNGYFGNGINGTGLPVILKSIAVLPLENLTDNPESTAVVLEHIKRELKGKGWVLITKSETVEKFLSKRRVRYTGAITRLTVREMGKVLGIDAVLVGSVTQFSATKVKATVGVTARIVSALDGSILWVDNRAYTTRDFEGILGLGAVTSLDELSSIVVKDLANSIADKFFIKEASLSPFEIERVAAYPALGKGGEEISLRVKVLPILEEPKEVKVVVEGVEVDLTMVDEEEYEGKVMSPEGEGVYFVDVIAMDQSMTPFSFEAAGKIVVDNTPPKISMTLDKNIFASTKRKPVIISTKLLSLDDIDEWSIEILDKDGTRVRGDRGYGTVPKKLMWRGDTDARSVAEDGMYTCRFSVKDVAGNKTVITDMLRLKNSPPAIRVGIDIMDDVMLFMFDYDAEEHIASWEFSIHDRDGKLVKRTEGEGDVPEKIEYPLDNEIDFRRLAFSLTAQDDAGNSFEMTKPLSAMLTGRIPFAGLKEKSRFFDDF
jgi:hypothetical protein